MKVSVKLGDTVLVNSGKDSGKKGKVLAINKTKNGVRVVVEGVNIVTKAKKARTAQEKSELVKIEAGIDVSNSKERQLIKYAIGYMPQIFNLYLDLTVKENLNYLSAIFNLNKKNVVESLIKECNLESKSNVLAKNLSGGYKQLLCLAGALIHSPQFLILDEPTSAMDPVFRTIFWKIIKSYKKKGVTIFVITHHIEELLECDSFACLSEGKIIFDGSVDQFKSGDFINIREIMSKFYERKKV